MAVFPALRPGTRTFTAATYPGVAHIAYSGRESRVRTSNASTGARLRLQFPGISEAQMLEIASHYAGQRGRFLPFTLPDAVLSGMTNPAALTPAGYLWIYAGSPKVVDISTGTAAAPSCVHDVELELELVPEVSRLASGARWSAVAAIAGGVANGGNVSLAGAQWSAAASITSADNIYDGSASGAAWSATASIVGGSVNYAVTTAGAEWTASAAIAGGAGSGAETDPNFSSVSLLLHMDGSNGSTTFTDSSSSPKAITKYGNAQISTTQSKFGGASGLFDGNGDYLTASSADFSFGTGDFTVEGWMYVVDGTSYKAIASFVSGSNNNSLYVLNSTLIWFDVTSRAASASFSLSTWHHFAVTRASGVVRVFLNGTKSSSDYTTSFNIASGSVRIGVRGASLSEFFNGYIDDFRITKGVARYTANFTPPTAAFPNS